MGDAHVTGGGMLFSQEILHEIAGAIGVALYLCSYAALQAGWIRGNGYLYAGLNMAAAGLVLVSLAANWNLSAAVIQISWITISVVGITRVWLLTRALRFTPEEEGLIASRFATMRRIDARRLLDRGVWHDGAAGTGLTGEGEPVTHLVWLADGGADVIVGGQKITEIGGGEFIGELASLHRGPASATVVLNRPTRYFAIPSEAMQALIRNNPDLRAQLEFAFAGNIRSKLIATNARLEAVLKARDGASPGVDRPTAG